jgi:hypothetical protein
MGQNKYIWIGCALLGLGLSAACGGSEDDGGGTPSGGQGGESGAGTGGSSGESGAGAGGTGGGTAVTPLPADTAGKPCTMDNECDRGTCATMVEGLDGVPTPAPGGYCMASCAESVDCGSGGSCVPGVDGGTCYETCTMDADCREGYLCGPLTSTCRPAPATDQLTDNTAGIACAADPDCGDGVCLTQRLSGEPFPGGYCSGACLEDSHCGAGGICVRFGGAAGRCYDTCAADPDCTRDGYRCRMLNETAMGCLPAADPLPDNTTGNACVADADCGGAMGSCATVLPAIGGGEVEAPAGYCTSLTCEIDADCGAGGICAVTRDGTRCFKPCTTSADCRPPYDCLERGIADPPTTVCTPFQPDGGVDDPDGGVDGGM